MSRKSGVASPVFESDRIQNLRKYQILNTTSEPAFEKLAQHAAHVFNVPIALINFVYTDYVWVKAGVGITSGNTVPNDISLCSIAILNESLTLFEDTWKVDCLLSNPMVASSYGLRFYAAIPIRTAEGLILAPYVSPTMCQER
ncbi:MAG: GAF domain-containing protein [Sphingobacteriaceae bacterium]|nr:GAF domain-containing protein [Sphingobacteriaceae bacterium]